jgi:hypothetical protein
MAGQNMGRDAGNSFLSGFSGCLGVGFAVIVVCLLVLAGCAALAHGVH